MLRVFEPVVKRFGRYIIDYALAYGVQWVIGILAGLQVPPEFQPVIAALIAALGKFFRTQSQLPIPF